VAEVDSPTSQNYGFGSVARSSHRVHWYSGGVQLNLGMISLYYENFVKARSFAGNGILVSQDQQTN